MHGLFLSIFLYSLLTDVKFQMSAIEKKYCMLCMSVATVIRSIELSIAYVDPYVV